MFDPNAALLCSHHPFTSGNDQAAKPARTWPTLAPADKRGFLYMEPTAGVVAASFVVQVGDMILFDFNPMLLWIICAFSALIASSIILITRRGRPQPNSSRSVRQPASNPPWTNTTRKFSNSAFEVFADAR